MILYTIGFTKKTAEQFFEAIKASGTELLLDIRLNNKSQLACFTKEDDLHYFLKNLCGCGYQHCEEYAPTKQILDDYKKKVISWEEYVQQYLPLMERRRAVDTFFQRFSQYKTLCLLCSEPTPERCHRRLLAELLAQNHPEVEIRHL